MAKRRLLQVFDLLDDCASQLERNDVVQGWEDGGSFSPNRGDAIRFRSSGNKLGFFAVKHN
jgi:hypothetical protein